MRGYIRKRDKDVWQLVVDLPKDPISGNRRQKYVTVHGSKRKAEFELQKLLVSVKDEKVRSSTQSVASAMTEWFDRVREGLSPTTVQGYEGRIRRQILPELGALAIHEVSASHLDLLYQDLVRQGNSPASIRQTHAIIRRFFNQAMKWGWTGANPALLASPPKVRVPQVVTPSIDQLTKLLEEARAVHPQWGAFFLLAALTGMRRGELCALHWDDCKETGITVAKSLIYTSPGGTREAPTKTHQARFVALDEVAQSLIEDQKKQLQLAAQSVGLRLVVNPYLFYSEPDGSLPVHPDSPSKLFRRLADKYGWNELHLHSLRHFSATQLVAAGVDIRTVAGRLGHAEASVTLKVYSHVLEAKNQEAASIMGTLLGSPIKQEEGIG
ncbi:site-specific integrase [Ferrimicrobium sp.]|uniref:tyrosine-type recombinase/integrase n=1 Tax=Ferrimicrobium sp. TaxID=2926050 RepID=UPI002625FE61|nr:site-specific integrase [Ferrimicrobium sp.]